MIDLTLERICQEEGFRAQPYHDSRGFWTVGYGFNLDAGMTKDEARALAAIRLDQCRKLLGGLSFYNALDEVRRSVLDDMCYNLGWGKLAQFHDTLGAIERGDWLAAGDAMMTSFWYRQTGERAKRLVDMMRTGQP